MTKEAGQQSTGLFRTLTPEQQARALAYDGPEDIMPPKQATADQLQPITNPAANVLGTGSASHDNRQ